MFDIDSEFRRRGYRKSVGVKTAVALVFDRRFIKSRKATTSNWANRQLTDAQLRYAANDAYAAIRVFDALGLAARLVQRNADGEPGARLFDEFASGAVASSSSTPGSPTGDSSVANWLATRLAGNMCAPARAATRRSDSSRVSARKTKRSPGTAARSRSR